MISPTVITEPAREPVSLTEAKSQCRIDSATEDTHLALFITAARKHVESLTGRAIIEQTLEWTLDRLPVESFIILPRATPLISITSFIYKDSGATAATWAAANYIADVDFVPGRLVLAYNTSWPSFTAYPVSPIRIRYKAGIAVTSPLVEADASLKLAILMLVGALFENRESVIASQDSAAVKQISMLYGVDAFLAQHVASYVF
jgi:uncharacterized phiE125 gp8 family phage protein